MTDPVSPPTPAVVVPREACPKCLYVSGDDWTQCGGSCPMPESPHPAPVPVEPRPSARADGEREAIARIIDGMAVDIDLVVYERLCGAANAQAMNARRDAAHTKADAILALRPNPPAETAEAVAWRFKFAASPAWSYRDERPDLDWMPQVHDLTPLYALAQPAPQPVAGEDEVGRAAAAVFMVFKPDHMIAADWNNRTVLGAGNSLRVKCYAAAQAALRKQGGASQAGAEEAPDAPGGVA